MDAGPDETRPDQTACGGIARRSILAVGAGVVAGGLAVAGWQVLAGGAEAQPPRDQPTPVVDALDLAQVHATSRLQYDECQEDYADIAGEKSSSRNPLYFC